MSKEIDHICYLAAAHTSLIAVKKDRTKEERINDAMEIAETWINAASAIVNYWSKI